MRGVQFDRAKSSRIGALRCCRKGPLECKNSIDAELLRRRVALAERDRARPDCPPSPFGLRNAALPGPGAMDACLSPGVRKLDSRDSALRLCKADDPLQRLEMFVAPNSKILRGDPPFGRNRRRLSKDQGGASDRTGAEVREVPIVGKTIVAGILAHRRDADSIGERDVTYSEFAEQMGHWALSLAVGSQTALERSRQGVSASRGRARRGSRSSR